MQETARGLAAWVAKACAGVAAVFFASANLDIFLQRQQGLAAMHELVVTRLSHRVIQPQYRTAAVTAYHPVEPVLGTARRASARVAIGRYRTAATFFASGDSDVLLQKDTATACEVLQALGTATGWQLRGRGA